MYILVVRINEIPHTGTSAEIIWRRSICNDKKLNFPSAKEKCNKTRTSRSLLNNRQHFVSGFFRYLFLGVLRVLLYSVSVSTGRLVAIALNKLLEKTRGSWSSSSTANTGKAMIDYVVTWRLRNWSVYDLQDRRQSSHLGSCQSTKIMANWAWQQR